MRIPPEQAVLSSCFCFQPLEECPAAWLERVVLSSDDTLIGYIFASDYKPTHCDVKRQVEVSAGAGLPVSALSGPRLCRETGHSGGQSASNSAIKWSHFLTSIPPAHRYRDGMDAAQIFANGAWTPIDLALALKMPKRRVMRCPECHGRIRAHKVGANGEKAHMEHSERHKGCSRGDCFEGVTSMHPKNLDRQK